MLYFRERHNLKNDYSGHEEVSSDLRNKLFNVVSEHTADHPGLGQERFYLVRGSLNYELVLKTGKDDIFVVIREDDYGYVFEAIEIFMEVAKKKLRFDIYEKALFDTQQAFSSSGSVYYFKDGKVELKMDKETAENLKEAERILKEHKTTADVLFDAVGGFIKRKIKARDFVKDVFIAFENYLKNITKAKDFGKAILELQKKELITANQTNILNKIYVYVSNAFRVRHSGGSREPDEIDSIWFLDIILAQLKLIDKRIKQQKK